MHLSCPPKKYVAGYVWSLFFIAFSIILLLEGCGGNSARYSSTNPLDEKKLARIGYTVQAGVFNNLDNAVRLTEDLQNKGINAYYFVYKRGVYKVRFGDYPSKDFALLQARKLQRTGLIDDFYVISPDDSSASKSARFGDQYLRRRIVSTAKSFLGVPYRWGGTSERKGFDCSGLTMAVFNLNGLKIPRSSRRQFRAGTPVRRIHLARGDLVFFATSGGNRVSHVGIYIGDGNFIHAPNRGKRVRTESLSKSYYADRYVGARRYF